MGVWQVRGRWVIGISGRCSAQSVGKPPLAGNFIGANVRWRILNPLNFCHRTILLDRNSSVWADNHGTLVGGWAELICGWQATNRSMAGSYKSAFRSVPGHPPASVEGGYKNGLLLPCNCYTQISGISSVCSTVCLGADQRKHQSSLHKRPVTPTMFPKICWCHVIEIDGWVNGWMEMSVDGWVLICSLGLCRHPSNLI